jgi:hypothetical protein
MAMQCSIEATTLVAAMPQSVQRWNTTAEPWDALHERQLSFCSLCQQMRLVQAAQRVLESSCNMMLPGLRSKEHPI